MVVPFQCSYYIICKYMYCMYLVPSFFSLWNSGTCLKTLQLSPCYCVCTVCFFVWGFKNILKAAFKQFEGWNEICILSNWNVKNWKDVGSMIQKTKTLLPYCLLSHDNICFATLQQFPASSFFLLFSLRTNLSKTRLTQLDLDRTTAVGIFLFLKRHRAPHKLNSECLCWTFDDSQVTFCSFCTWHMLCVWVFFFIVEEYKWNQRSYWETRSLW